MKNKEIAQKLNISPSTVSLALNNRAGVSMETRKKILELKNDALKKDLSKNFASDQEGEIGFIFYKQTGRVVTETPFFVTLTEVICKYANKNGYSVEIIYYTLRNDLENFIKGINESDLAGYLILGTEIDVETMKKIKKLLRKPFVVLDASFPGIGVDSVLMDNPGGIYQAMEYAVEMGHRKIGYINCGEQTRNFIERYESFKYYLKEFGLEYNPEFIYDVPYLSEEICDCMKRQLNYKNEFPSIIIAANDIIAMGTLNAFIEMNIKVPEQISLIGFDDMPATKYLSPGITTIKLNNHIIGEKAVQRLIEMIKDPKQNSIRIQSNVSVELIIRDSVIRKQETLWEE